VPGSSGQRFGTLPRPTDLEAQARTFADELSRLLNKTVTNGIPIRSVLREDGAIGWVGYKITKVRFAPGSLIPVTIGRAPPSCFLHVMLTLQLDPEIRRLVVQRSTFGLYTNDDFESMILHYDFERESENKYPDAHFQVSGDSEALAGVCSRVGRSVPLRDLHFPVGGRRYRPSVEDIVEFLIVEELALGHDGWEAVVNEHRDRWHRVQLLSVVRRNPEWAAEELQRQGYKIEPPPNP
jgi:hypothetical protein